MTFRSDDDAREERMRGLERQLEEARRELSVARPQLLRLEVAEKENRRLVAELARLGGQRGGGGQRGPGASGGARSGVASQIGLLVGLVALLVVGLIAAGVFLALKPTADDPAVRSRAAEQRDAERRAEEASAAAQAQAAAEADRYAQRAAEAAQIAAAAAAPEPPVAGLDPSRVASAPLVDRTVEFAPIDRRARVRAVSGAAPVAVGARCRITLTAEQGDCRADVRCGDESLYPRAGNGGFFHCQVEEHVVHTGHDANPSPSSGDPRLELDADAREVTISDTAPDWSVRLAYEAH